MAAKANDAVFLALQEKYGQKVAQAFLDAIQELKSGADLQRLIRAISDGDIAGAEAALHLDPAAFNQIKPVLTEVFDQGGKNAVDGLPTLTNPVTGHKFMIRFDVGNPVAEAWLKDESSGLVTGILEDQRNAIRAVLEQGIQAGDNPTTTALRLVGRVDRATGERTGGIVGLTDQQAQYVQSARAELGSNNLALLRNYLSRALRDKRFDKAVLKAIETGNPVPADTASAAVRSYANRLLKYRGDLIGKVETFNALQTAKDEAYRQLIEKGAVSAQAVTKTWRHFPNEHPRLEHIAMNGTKIGFHQNFILPSGVTMKFPHDPDAPIDEVTGCHCVADYQISFLHGLK